MSVPTRQSRFKHSQLGHISKQSGSAMIVSLAILTILTLGAAISMQRSTLQVRMISNMHHKQQVTNATYSYIDNMISILRNDNTTTTVLGQLIEKEESNVSNGADPGSTKIDIYKEYNWPNPVLPNMKALASVDNTVTVTTQSDGTTPVISHRNSPNGSLGAGTYAYFTSTFTGTDKSGNLSTVMEQGFAIRGASQTQN